MKTTNWIFTGYDKNDNVIDTFIIEDRTENEAQNEALHYVEQHQKIQDWSLSEEIYNPDFSQQS